MLAGIDDLAGREIDIRQSSSYWGHLQALSASPAAKGLKEITLTPADENLEDEDLLEMVNAGLLPFAVVDDYKARFWALIFPQLKVREDLIVSTGGDIAWAVRKNSPLLLAEINEFVARKAGNLSFFNEVMRKYYGSARILKNAYSPAAQAEYQRLIAFFKAYGDKYDFDYLMIAAQGFQESRLDQGARSHMGAVGIMQLLPSTAADPKIGITGIDRDAERNIEAGVKYLRHLVDVYLDDPKLDQKNRTLMAFAAYNAGPGNLIRFRKWAAKSGFDPNLWFYNVEEGAARIVGQETVQYVSNIYKYYVAYKLRRFTTGRRRRPHRRSGANAPLRPLPASKRESDGHPSRSDGEGEGPAGGLLVNPSPPSLATGPPLPVRGEFEARWRVQGRASVLRLIGPLTPALSPLWRARGK